MSPLRPPAMFPTDTALPSSLPPPHHSSAPPPRSPLPPRESTIAPREGRDGGPLGPAAERAYRRLGARILEQQRKRVTMPIVTVRVQDVPQIAIDCDDRLRRGERMAAIQALARLGFVRLSLVEDLRDAALAALYVFNKVGDGAEPITDASLKDTAARRAREAAASREASDGPRAAFDASALSTALRQEANDVRKRMRGVVEGALREPSDRDLLRQFRSGAGDLALANDLLAYAKLYGDRRADLARASDFHLGDETLARRLAIEVRRQARSSERTDTWTALRPGAIALVLEHYEEAARAGRFLDRDDACAMYPTLVAAPLRR